MKKYCQLCGAEREFIYNLDGYRIEQCKFCKTVCVDNMPDDKTLKEYYKGFKYCIDEDNIDLIVNDDFKKWYESFKLPPNAKMLDIGGGNGYFSLAFEKFGFGEATYIDLDSEACRYVKKLGISAVINDDVKNLAANKTEKFDFIYSRHVIEHLPNPLSLIENAISLLSDDGVFVLQMPNGLSLERLIDFQDKENRIKSLMEANSFSRLDVERILHSSKTAFDLAPPRHLWAFSKKGLKEYLAVIPDIEFKIRTYSLRDKIYSPYMSRRYKHFFLAKLMKPLKNILRVLYSMPAGGGHLVVEIRKK